MLYFWQLNRMLILKFLFNLLCYFLSLYNCMVSQANGMGGGNQCPALEQLEQHQEQQRSTTWRSSVSTIAKNDSTGR
jgi:hypothetical protein